MVSSKETVTSELTMVEMERMSINERRKYLYKMWEGYRSASRKEKGYPLDEMQAVTGMHRKSLIRILTGQLSRKPRNHERGVNIRDGGGGCSVGDCAQSECSVCILISFSRSCAPNQKSGWMSSTTDVFDMPKTLFERLCEIETLPPDRLAQLQAFHRQTNPLHLRQHTAE
ncbi:MAG: hypothetical protein AB1457_07880 [Chloroflexota bacterium]